MKARGDCFEVAGKYVAGLGGTGRGSGVLVHGLVTGQGPVAGLRFGHAWVEIGDEVMDRSNGRNLRLPRAVYYATGKIDASSTFRYTPEQAREKMLDTGHYGPWDLKSEL